MHRGRLGCRRGFTVTDLLALVVAICFVGVLGLQICCASKERANRVKCASNLRQIGQGQALYVNDFKCYPLTLWDPDTACKPEFDNVGFDSADGKAITPNNITAAMFLLVRTADLNPEVFVCPSSNQEKDTMGGFPVAARSNFSSGDNVSYSITNPYPRRGPDGGTERGYLWSQHVSADFAIGADRNDGTRDATVLANSPTREQRRLNSFNHEQEGQNILFNDGHVEWGATPWVGAYQDNVYTRAVVVPKPGETKPEQAFAQASVPASDAEGFPEPALALDSVMLPTWTGPIRFYEDQATLWRGAIILLIIGVVVVAMFRAIRRTPAQACL